MLPVQLGHLSFLTHHIYAAKTLFSCRDSQESQRLFLIEVAEDRLTPCRNGPEGFSLMPSN
jgi:hypothetical protein